MLLTKQLLLKNHAAKRTKNLCKIAQGFKFKRSLTGSPITKSPLDIYAQLDFSLQNGILGYDSYYAFQNRYAVIVKQSMGAKSFNQVIGYRNINELTQKIDDFSYRVLKKTALIYPKAIHSSLCRHDQRTKGDVRVHPQICVSHA